MPAFAMRHGGIRDPQEQMARGLHVGQEGMKVLARYAVRHGLCDHQIKAVHLLPHVRGDDLPDRPRILPRG